MRWLPAIGFLVVIAIPVSAQTKRPVQRRAPVPPPPSVAVARKEAVPDMTCPTTLGVGVKTKTAFCDVMTGSDPASGILITLPPHKGPLILTFNLHNRHTYS